MSYRALQKRLLLERVRANREMLGLEVDALRAKFDVAGGIFKFATDVLPQVGTAAAAAAGAAKIGKAGAGGALGLAALAPVVIAVAKLVVDRKRAAVKKKGEGESPQESAPAKGSEREID